MLLSFGSKDGSQSKDLVCKLQPEQGHQPFVDKAFVYLHLKHYVAQMLPDKALLGSWLLIVIFKLVSLPKVESSLQKASGKHMLMLLLVALYSKVLLPKLT